MSAPTGTTLFEVGMEVVAEEAKEFESTMRPRLSSILGLPGVEAADVYRGDRVEKPTVVFVLGGPGAGKGTQCARIVEDFGYSHISAGDCLRAERASGSEDADLINGYIKEGKIVPVDITIKLVLRAMEESGNSRFLIDGFPRDVENLEGWNRIVGDAVNVPFVLFFDCDEDTMLTRLLKRGESSGRVDDNISSIRKRFLTYHESTAPVIHSFEATGRVRTINATRPIELVNIDVRRVFSTLEEQVKPRVNWTIQYRLADQAEALDSATAEHERFSEELQKKFGSSLTVTTRVLRKVVDDEKVEAESGCSVM